MDILSNHLTFTYSSRVLLFCALPLLIIIIIIRSISAKNRNYPSVRNTSNQLTGIPRSSSSSSSSVPCSWDVFLSFYGKETRRNFIANLYFALDQAGIQTFRDEPALEKGERITSGLVNAIKDSEMFVVVISENYACSPWCLDELVEILSCRRTRNQVIPVFYYVDPSDLRHQKGSFGRALGYHKKQKRYSIDTIDKWKSALAEIAELSGYTLKKDANENESNTIQEIVEKVAAHAGKDILHLEECLFGIDPAVEEIYQKLRMESNDVRAIVICGMGGIGKTTTAQAFYNKYSNKFDISCFIENVKYSQEGSSLLSLLNQVLIKLLRRKDYKVLDVDSGMTILRKKLISKKALIVLDDLDQSSLSELLERLGKFFYVRSRIIITTRDANLLNQLQAYISEVDIYMVKVLGQSDSLQLFSYKAFGRPTPPENLRELTVSFVTYGGGLPLALKLLGSSLRGRTDVAFWKAKLAKLRKIPNKGIQKILQLSYDELEEETEKKIFLYIAFFFVGKVKDEAVHIFNSCEFIPDTGIPILVERCLLRIDEDDKFRMHNLIQGMGRELGKSEGLFWRGEPEDMHNLEGRKKIEGLILDKSPQGQIAPETFDKLSNLRILVINDAQDMKGNFTNSFPELRSIRWRGSPITHLSSSFLPRKLVSLDVSSSKLKTLWKSPRDMKQLTNLGNLNVARCYSLKRLPERVGDLKGLRMLDASHTAIEKLPDSICDLKGLVKLQLEGCRKLRELPKSFGNVERLRTLDATYTAIKQLPESFTGLIYLVELKLYGCRKLRKLPEQFGNMKGLRMLDASFSAIEQLPESFGRLINLVDLQLSDCKNLTSISNSVWKLKFLRVLNVKYCSMLKRLPEQLGMMKSLMRLDANGSAIEELPDSIGQLSKLQELHVNNKLKYVPASIWNLTSLTELSINQKDNFKIDLPDMVKTTKLEELSLRCNVRLWMPTIQSFSCLQKLTLIDDGQSVSSTEPLSLSKLCNLRDLTLVNLTSVGSSFPELPSDLKYLNIYNYKALQKFPDFSSLKQLRKLDIWKCFSLQSLPPLPPHLQILKVRDCTNLRDVPDLSMLKELETPTFTGCSKIRVTNSKETSLKVQPYLSSFKADLPNGELAEWFSYECSGSIVSFDTPPIMGDNILIDSLFVYYTSCKSKDATCYTIKAVITNKTQGIEYEDYIDVPSSIDDIAHSKVKSISGKDISLASGDILNVSFQASGEEVNVKTCGIYMTHKTPPPPASC